MSLSEVEAKKETDELIQRLRDRNNALLEYGRLCDQCSMVEEWHKQFGVGILTAPAIPSQAICELRVSLIREELEELEAAITAGDIVEVADALADLLYVVHGAGHAFGIPLREVFQEVHRSNMTKIWPDGTVKYREDGKVLKPPTYSPARIREVMYGLE